MSDIKYGIIYIAINIVNGKSYIGQTICKLEKRIAEHYHNSNTHFYKFACALKKYIADNWKWEILQNNIPIQYLDEMEKFYIFLFDTYKSGYNSTEGGDSNPMHNPENRKKVSNALKGKKHTEETKRKISEAHMGIRPSEETRKKLSIPKSDEHKKKILITKSRRYLYTITEPNGNVKTVTNLKKYCDENGLDKSNLYSVVSGKIKQHKGYIAKRQKQEPIYG